MRSQRISAEILKAARGEWLTAEEIAESADISQKAATHWAQEWAVHGVLKSRAGAKRHPQGPAPQEFTLSSKWGGL